MKSEAINSALSCGSAKEQGGGTMSMADVPGTASLYGTVTYDEIGVSTFNGTIYLNYCD